MSKFQLILTTVLGLAIVAGSIAFATTKSSSKDRDAEQIVVWGTLPSVSTSAYFSSMNSLNRKTVNVQYVYKQPETFERDLIEAIADRKGPDGIIISDGLLYRLKEKLFVVPFKSYPERAFKDSFISAEEIFIDSQKGVMAFPFSIDPLVLYWNRDILSSSGFSRPPIVWEELFAYSPKITKKDQSGNILQSTIALGDLSNVKHGKEILSTLMLQAGSSIVSSEGNQLKSGLTEKKGLVIPAEEALRFFTEFVNPSKDSYTWNKSLPNSFNAFIGGQLAMYIGYASEFTEIREKNPNLNFDVAFIPQTSNSSTKINYGKSLALAIMKSSSKVNIAITAFSALTSTSNAEEWSKSMGFTPVRRDLLGNKTIDPLASIANKSALISKFWVDPNYTETLSIFFKMVDRVSSGRSSVVNSVTEASQNLNSLIR